jgi:hypothetical protein
VIEQRHWTREQEEWRGHYYGYPQCCIDFYLRLKYDLKVKYPGEYAGVIFQYGFGYYTSNAGYVQCPRCTANLN